MKKIACIFLGCIFSSTLFAQTPEMTTQTSPLTIHVTTELLPPLSYRGKNAEIVGISTKIVRELFKQANIKYTLTMMNWDSAYKLALEHENYAVYSTARTPAREKSFKWVGPITSAKMLLYSKKSKNINISSIDQAKKYRVATYKGDVSINYLKQQGFKKIVLEKTYLDSLAALLRGDADLWISDEFGAGYLVRDLRIHNLNKGFELTTIYLYIAFNKNTPDSLIVRLNKILRQIKSKNSAK